jgi:hypothetical protein
MTERPAWHITGTGVTGGQTADQNDTYRDQSDTFHGTDESDPSIDSKPPSRGPDSCDEHSLMPRADAGPARRRTWGHCLRRRRMVRSEQARVAIRS